MQIEEDLVKGMQASGKQKIEHKDFLDLVAPSFAGVEDKADLAAILARTHLIVLTDHGVYWRLASTGATSVPFIPWPNPEAKDLLAEAERPIFRAYKRNPQAHELPESFHADSIWSQELLARLLRGEQVPRTITIRGRGLFGGELVETQQAPRLLPPDEMSMKIKQEKVDSKFKELKSQRIDTIELDTPSPSPAKRSRVNNSSLSSSAMPADPPQNPDFPGIGESDGLDELDDELQNALEFEGGHGSLDGFENACLVVALQNLGCPVACPRDGPFTALDGCVMLRPLGASLQIIPRNMSLTQGKYVVLDIQASHFFALQHIEGFAIKMDGDDKVEVSIGMLSSMMLNPRYYFFKVVLGIPSSSTLLQVPYSISGGALARKVYSTQLTKCPCGHRSFSKGHDVAAVVYTLAGPCETTVRTMRCNAYGCRTTFGPNFLLDDGKKINTATLENVPDVLFVNNKLGFSLDYLKYHSALEFRGFLAARAIEAAYKSVFDHEHSEVRFRAMHADCVMYWLALQELSLIGCEKDIVIGDEISEAALRKYDDYVHKVAFPPKKRASVTELVGDGHSKVHIKCGETTTHAGRPRKDGSLKPFGHGWFMLVNPQDQRILCVVAMDKPENNPVVQKSLEKVLPLYQKVNGFIMDRVCGFAPTHASKKSLSQIKYWSLDKFHAHRHKKTCVYNPLCVKRLSRRFAKTNTSACEQVFSWFRNYARILNEARAIRHTFKVLYFSKLHNQAVAENKASYLNKFKKAVSKVSKAYAC